MVPHFWKYSLFISIYRVYRTVLRTFKQRQDLIDKIPSLECYFVWFVLTMLATRHMLFSVYFALLMFDRPVGLLHTPELVLVQHTVHSWCIHSLMGIMSRWWLRWDAICDCMCGQLSPTNRVRSAGDVDGLILFCRVDASAFSWWSNSHYSAPHGPKIYLVHCFDLVQLLTTTMFVSWCYNFFLCEFNS